ncbi:MAG: MFS transporter, partial [Gammaproteobacteria bacterium]|nr:MFS transporter [Gammaproteobacteria bacterium]
MQQQIQLKFPLQAWVVVLAASLFFFYEFVQMTMFNSISADLMQSFHISGKEFGFLSAAYFYGIVSCLFPAGLLLDRFSTRKLVLGAFGVCIISTIFMALAMHFYMAFIARFIIGASTSLCFVSAIRLASRWFSPTRLAFVVGVIVTMAMLGGFVAQTPFTLLVDYLADWRYAVLVNAGLGVLFWLLIYFNVKDFPASYQQTHQANLKKLESMGFWHTIWCAIMNTQNWLAGLFTSFMNLSVFLLASSFGSLYLMQINHFSKAQASWVSSMIFLGTIIGSPLLGALSDKWCLRRMPMIITAVISLLLVLIIIYVPHL